jgi:hypothetical protein
VSSVAIKSSGTIQYLPYEDDPGHYGSCACGTMEEAAARRQVRRAVKFGWLWLSLWSEAVGGTAPCLRESWRGFSYSSRVHASDGLAERDS